jgi:hypothetical protein
VDSEKLPEHVKEHKERNGLLNSQYSDNLHKERFEEEVAEEMTQTGRKCCRFFISIPFLAGFYCKDFILEMFSMRYVNMFGFFYCLCLRV